MQRSEVDPRLDRPAWLRCEGAGSGGQASRLLLVGTATLGMVSEANAAGQALVIGQTLALSGLLVGAIGGAFAGFKGSPPTAVWPAFGIYLGLLCALASTRAGSLEIVPLTLVLGGAAGIVPFAAGWFLIRFCWRRLAGRNRSQRP